MEYINKKLNNLIKFDYNIKINSKDRNIIREPNPFNYKITFNQINNGYSINSSFKNIKKIDFLDLIIPSKIYDGNIGYKILNLYLIKTDNANAIIINKNSIYEISNTGSDIDIILDGSVVYTLSNNNIIMFNNIPYFISNINKGKITFTTNIPDGIFPLILGNENITYLLEENITINNSSITLSGTNYDYITEIIYNDALLLIEYKNGGNTEYIVFKYSKLNGNVILGSILQESSTLPNNINATIFLINPNYINSADNKCYYLYINEYTQNKNTSHDQIMNHSIGLFYPSKVLSTEWTHLEGHGCIEFNNLKSINTLTVGLYDEEGNKIGNFYKNLSNNDLNNKYNQSIISVKFESKINI